MALTVGVGALWVGAAAFPAAVSAIPADTTTTIAGDGGDVNAPVSTLLADAVGLPAPSLVPGRIGQSARFDGKNFIQFGGDVAGFDSYGSGRGAIGANDPTVTYDDGYTMAAWIYPTAPSGAIVTRRR